MNLKLLLSLCLLLVPFTAPAVAEVARPCLEYSEDLTTGGSFQTKIAQAAHVDDADWRVTRIAGDPASQPARTILTHPVWPVPSSYARYVNPWLPKTPYSDNDLAGGTKHAPVSQRGAYDYTYVTEFTISPDLESGYTIKLRIVADNNVTLKLNGQPLDLFTNGPAGLFSGPKQVDYGELKRSMARFKVGVNTLEANVATYSTYTGLLVEGEFRAVCLWSPYECTEDSLAFVTGEGKSPGQPDASWTVGGAPAKAVARDPGWVAPPSGSWINPTGASPAPNGTHVYRLVFNLHCLPFDCATSKLAIDFSADDHVTLRLNGKAITPTYYSTWATLRHLDHDTCQNTFLLGDNVLESVVTNTGGPGGLAMRVFYQ